MRNLISGMWTFAILALTARRFMAAARPSRVKEMLAATSSSGSRSVSTLGLSQRLESVGRVLNGTIRSVVSGRGNSVQEKRLTALLMPDRTAGALFFVAGAASFVSLRVAAGIVLGCAILRPVAVSLEAKRAGKTAEAKFEVCAPVLIDAVRTAVAAGSLPRTIILELTKGPRLSALDPLLPNLKAVAAALDSGQLFSESLELLNVGPALRPLVSVLQSAERYGLQLGPSLDSLAADARSLRRRRLEAKARRLPITLLFPLVVFILPAFATLTVVPLLITGFSSVHI